MPRQRRTNDELQRASLAVQGEMMSLFASHDLLHTTAATWNSPDRVKAASNAYLHAMLLAARSLLAFLYAYQPRSTDIIAEDFFDDPDSWATQRAVPAPEMANGELTRQVSQRLAHLTWHRTDTTKPLWGAFPIVWNIYLGLQSFVKLVEPTRVHDAFSEDAALGMTALERARAQWPELNGQMAPTIEQIAFDDLHYFGA